MPQDDGTQQVSNVHQVWKRFSPTMRVIVGGGALIDWLGFYSLLWSGFVKVAEIHSDHSLCLLEQSTAPELPLPPPLLVEIAQAHFNLPSPGVSYHFMAFYVSSGFIFLDHRNKNGFPFLSFCFVFGCSVPDLFLLYFQPNEWTREPWTLCVCVCLCTSLTVNADYSSWLRR